MSTFMKTLRINLYGVINTLSLKEKFFYSKNWIEDGIVMLKNIRLNNGILDVGFLANIIQDKRQFYREINILQKTLS